MSFEGSVHAKAIELTKMSIDMTASAGSGHPTSAASLAHIVTVLMYDFMRYDPANPGLITSDRLVLSEGHAVPIIYAACADLGVMFSQKDQLKPMTQQDAMTLRAIDSPIDGHPNPVEGFPFFDAATGSLGQGLSVAAGLACGARLDNLDKRIYCIIGDGESREGQIFEAVDFIIEHNLTAVCPIFNCNVYAQSDKVSNLQTPAITQAKLQAVGYEVRMINGHNPTEIKAALNDHAIGNKPFAIVANTVKGWGAQTMQGQGHHGVPITGETRDKVFAELDATGNSLIANWADDLNIPPVTTQLPAISEPQDPPNFSDAMKMFGKTDVLDNGKWATRRAYGIALKALGHAVKNVVVLDADVKNSTFAIDFYNDLELQNRFFECRIAEQNMVSTAAGLSAAGKIPFLSSFAKFITRAYDQLEMAVNSGANFKVIGSHAGVSLAADGPSQMSLPDVAWFRSFSTIKNHKGNPAMYVLQPADAFCAYALTIAMAEYDGPCYMRTLRPDTPFLYNDDTIFNLGGHQIITQGKDLLIIASGYMVHEALKAIPQLKETSINPTLIDLYSLPFDANSILDQAQANNGMVLTLEDNYGASYGSAIADALAEDGGAFTLKQLHVRKIPKSGRTPDEVMQYLGLSVEDIVKAGKELMNVASI